MTGLDWIVIAGYFALIIGVTWWVVLTNKETADGYFLAGRGLGWFIVGSSIFASNIGSEHLVGLAGSGATDGVAMAHYELHAWCILILGWVFVPFYMRSKVFTMPEFLEKRFNPASRMTLSLMALLSFVLCKIAVSIFAGGIVFRALLPNIHIGPLDSFWVGSLAVIFLTGIYTVLGGMRAVAYTEALQTFILVSGSAMVTYFGLKYLGGWGQLKEIVGSDMFNLWKPIVRAGAEGTWSPVQVKDAAGTIVKEAWYFNSNYPWLSMLFCAPVIGLWYWCTCQFIVQRALGAENEQQARRGTIFASYLKLLPVFIFIIPGMICFALAKSNAVPALHNALYVNGTFSREAAQQAFPLMVTHILPAGVRGLVVAGLLAALMSSLAGAFNASSTLFTMDFYSKLHKGVSQKQLVWIGRVATVVMVLISLAWLPVLRHAKGLYDYLQGIQAYLAPPVFVVFFCGVFFKRLNGPGCLATLLIGFVMGLVRLAIDTPVQMMGVQYDEGSFFWIMNKMFFQYYSIIITVVCTAVLFVVSYATAAPNAEQISGLTYGTVTTEHRAESRASWDKRDVVLSLGLLVFILAAYLYFRG